MDIYLILTLIFFSITVLLLMLLFSVRVIIIRMFGSFKNFFLRNKGYGNAYIFMPGNRYVRHYVPLAKGSKQITINEKNYTIIPEKMFYDDMGINSLMYYLEDTEPLTPKEKDKSDNMIRSSSFWSNIASMIKMYAEIKAGKDAGLLLILIIIIIVLLLVVAGMNGYLVYELTSKTASTVISI